MYENGCVNKTRLNLKKKKNIAEMHIQGYSGSIIFLGVSTFLNLEFWPSFEYRNEQFNLGVQLLINCCIEFSETLGI